MNFNERVQWCQIVLSFIKTKDSSSVDYAMQKKDRRAIDFMHRDLSEWIKGLSPSYHAAISEVLVAKLGKTLNQTLFGFDKSIERILKRGYIKTPEGL